MCALFGVCLYMYKIIGEVRRNIGGGEFVYLGFNFAHNSFPPKLPVFGVFIGLDMGREVDLILAHSSLLGPILSFCVRRKPCIFLTTHPGSYMFTHIQTAKRK